MTVLRRSALQQVSVPFRAVSRRPERLRPSIPWRVFVRVAGAVLIGIAIARIVASAPGGDWQYYWSLDPLQPYANSSSDPISGYQMSPVFAQLVAPLGSLPPQLFHLVTVAWSVVPLILIAGVGVAGIGLAIGSPIFEAVSLGNVFFLLAGALVVGFRWPAAWAFVLLTKVTPGVCLVWFAARREWRSLAVALGLTAILVVGSFAIAPGAWIDWFRLLAADHGHPPDFDLVAGIPLVGRLLSGAVLVWWAARRDERWLVVPAFVWMQPYVGLPALAMLLAILPLWRQRDRSVVVHP